MPSKTSKPSSRKELFPPKGKLGCSEPELGRIARAMAGGLRVGDRVLLEGPMGVGKSTFVRELLLGLEIEQPPEGSPSFPIAHEYHAPQGGVVHLDFYRLKSEDEIDEAGITAYFWERELLVICEWISSFPEFERRVLSSGRCFRVSLAFSEAGLEQRDVAIEPA